MKGTMDIQYRKQYVLTRPQSTSQKTYLLPDMKYVVSSAMYTEGAAGYCGIFA